MDGVGSRLGSAQARWNDYLGTAAADDAAALLASRSLYQISGLDRDRWTIIGMDLFRGVASEQVVIYATDRITVHADGPDPEEVKVTAIHLGQSTALDSFLQEAFNQVSVRLVSSAWRDKHLVVGETIS